jgi:hypothetical protein
LLDLDVKTTAGVFALLTAFGSDQDRAARNRGVAQPNNSFYVRWDEPGYREGNFPMPHGLARSLRQRGSATTGFCEIDRKSRKNRNMQRSYPCSDQSAENNYGPESQKKN